MYSKFVIRVLDEIGGLIGWTEVQGHARGDGCMWAEETFTIIADRDGIPSLMSVHWADVNVEVRLSTPLPAVTQGTPMVCPAGILMKIGEMPKEALPPVTVRAPIAIGVPVGNLAAVSVR